VTFLPQKFASACGDLKKTSTIAMDNATKALILELHNNHRSNVASGNVSLPAAAQMPTLQWDPEIAYLADLVIDKFLS